MDTYVSNKGRRRINPATETLNMVAASGQTITNVAAGTEIAVTVVAGARYLVTADALSTGVVHIGLVDCAAADRLWNVGPGQTIGIEIPADVTTIYFDTDKTATVAYLSQLFD